MTTGGVTGGVNRIQYWKRLYDKGFKLIGRFPARAVSNFACSAGSIWSRRYLFASIKKEMRITTHLNSLFIVDVGGKPCCH